MLFATGDLHGGIDIGKLNARKFPLQKQLTKADYVVVCGDFGCIWDGGNEDRYWLNWLEQKPFTTLFVDGNHENFPMLNAFPEEQWNGGRIHRIRPSVIHLMRGQVFCIDGMRCFTMGGASSHDRQHRKEGLSWWPEELPDDAERREALASLERAGWQVDAVFTHCAPDRVQARLAREYEPDALTGFLQYVDEHLRYDCWYFGHYHMDGQPTPKHRALYADVVRVR